MSYCAKCGQYLSDQTEYCPNCGAKNNSVPAAPAPEAQQPAYQQPVYQQPVYNRAPVYAADPNLPPKGANAPAIVGFVITMSTIFCLYPWFWIIGVPAWLTGFILCCVALKKAKSGDYRHPLKGLAIAGLIVSIILLAIVLLVLAATLIFMLATGGLGVLGEMMSQHGTSY